MELIEAFSRCPRCGHDFDKQPHLLSCSHCGLHFYVNPKPCTTVILRRKAEYLLVKRAVEPEKGKWDLPGGFVEPGETLEDSARREIKEELGIDLKTLSYIGSFHDLYNYQDIIYPTVAANFVAELPAEQEITPADDVSEYRFFRLADIPYEALAFPSIAAALRLVERTTS